MLACRSLTALLLIVLLAGLAPLAYADPPDPTWISGYWDDDDFDGVVVFIAAASALGAPLSTGSAPPLVPGARLDCAEPVDGPAALRIAVAPRAPPQIPAHS